MTFEFFGNYIHILELPILIFLLAAGSTKLYRDGTIFSMPEKLTLQYFFLLFLLFLCSILISSISAIKLESVFKALFKWLEIFLIAFMVFWYIDSFKKFKLIYFFMLFATSLSIFYTIYLILTANIIIFKERIFPGYDSLYAFALLSPIGFAQKNKLLNFLSFIFLISGLLSLSRGVWLSTFSLLFFYAKVFGRKNNLKILLLLSALAFILGFLFLEPFKEFLTKRVEEILTLQNVSNIERISLFAYGLIAFSSSPLWGIGALNFPYYLLSNNMIRGLVAKDISMLAPHNFFLQILAEQGLIGFTTICLIFFIIFIILKKSYKNLCNICERRYYIIGMCGLSICILTTLMLGFIANQFRLSFSLFIGLVLSMLKFEETKNENLL